MGPERKTDTMVEEEKLCSLRKLCRVEGVYCVWKERERGALEFPLDGHYYVCAVRADAK